MPPDEYFVLGGLTLNSQAGENWCDFDLVSLPVWGMTVTKGDPGYNPPAADGQVPADTPIDAVSCLLNGYVYGDHTQAGALVSGLGACRMQLRDNIAALQAKVGTRVTATYHLFSDTFASEVTVLSLRQGDGSDDGPVQLAVTLELWFASGRMIETGS